MLPMSPLYKENNLPRGWFVKCRLLNVNENHLIQPVKPIEL